MKKTITGNILTGLIFLIFFSTPVKNSWGIGDVDIIMQRMMSLGFLDNKIDRQRDGSYTIKVNAYTQKTQALTLDAVFQPFKVRAKFSRGTLYLEKADIENAGFVVNKDNLPNGINIIRMRITYLTRQKQKILKDPDIKRIEQALAETKRHRRRVFANFRNLTHTANKTFAATFPDVCNTPAPAGPIPIPYPNMPNSSDTGNWAKKVKIDANRAEAIAKASEIRGSESDEVGTRMKKLQKNYQKTIAKREISTKEKAAFKRELQTCLEKATLLKNTLNKYTEEIEKLLKQAKKQ
jgi:hypothetical protein